MTLQEWFRLNFVIGRRRVAYPKPTAAAIARPKAADLPRPLAAVMATVLLNVFSEMASMNLRIPLAFKWTQDAYKREKCSINTCSISKSDEY